MARSDYSTDAASTQDESTYHSRNSYASQDEFEERNKPATKSSGISGLNRRLRTEYIDVDPNDEGVAASLTRGIVGLVGACFTPRQILVALRLLKAITVCFIVLTAAADVVYISMVEFVADSYEIHYFGARRDTILRVYGLILSVVALLIELDKFVMKNFKILKGFIARFMLLFFIATVTYCHPAQHTNSEGYGYDDDNYSGVPPSAVVFQMVSSVVLAICSFMYLLFGLLCFDRFTSRAFLSTQDPVASTAIPSRDPYESPSVSSR